MGTTRSSASSRLVPSRATSRRLSDAKTAWQDSGATVRFFDHASSSGLGVLCATKRVVMMSPAMLGRGRATSPDLSLYSEAIVQGRKRTMFEDGVLRLASNGFDDDSDLASLCLCYTRSTSRRDCPWDCTRLCQGPVIERNRRRPSLRRPEEIRRHSVAVRVEHGGGRQTRGSEARHIQRDNQRVVTSILKQVGAHRWTAHGRWPPPGIRSHGGDLPSCAPLPVTTCAGLLVEQHERLHNMLERPSVSRPSRSVQ
jgi:hypothetical protein